MLRIATDGLSQESHLDLCNANKLHFKQVTIAAEVCG